MMIRCDIRLFFTRKFHKGFFRTEREERRDVRVECLDNLAGSIVMHACFFLWSSLWYIFYVLRWASQKRQTFFCNHLYHQHHHNLAMFWHITITTVSTTQNSTNHPTAPLTFALLIFYEGSITARSSNTRAFNGKMLRERKIALQNQTTNTDIITFVYKLCALFFSIVHFFIPLNLYIIIIFSVWRQRDDQSAFRKNSTTFLSRRERYHHHHCTNCAKLFFIIKKEAIELNHFYLC